MFATEFGRWFALFFLGTPGFANGDHELGLLGREFAAAERASAPTDFGEVLADFGGQREAFGVGHGNMVSGLRCFDQHERFAGPEVIY